MNFEWQFLLSATQPTSTLFPRKYKADDQTGAYSQPAIRLSLFQLQRWACVYRKQPQKGRRNRCVVASLFLAKMTRRSAHGALILQLHTFPHLKCMGSPLSRIDQDNYINIWHNPLLFLPPSPSELGLKEDNWRLSTLSLALSSFILAPRARAR